MAPLDARDIDAALTGTAWRREGDALVRDAAFPDFAAALAEVNRVAALAEAANHHPDILLHGWRHVRLTLRTHTAGGITRADIDLAREIDRS